MPRAPTQPEAALSSYTNAFACKLLPVQSREFGPTPPCDSAVRPQDDPVRCASRYRVERSLATRVIVRRVRRAPPPPSRHARKNRRADVRRPLAAGSVQETIMPELTTVRCGRSVPQLRSKRRYRDPKDGVPDPPVCLGREARPASVGLAHRAEQLARCLSWRPTRRGSRR